MMLLREAAGISSDNMIPRNDPAYLMRETLKPGSAAAKTTLVVVVAKAPEAWVASSILRPHPHYKPMAGRRLSEDDIDTLLERRAKSHRDAFRSNGPFENGRRRLGRRGLRGGLERSGGLRR